MSVILILLTASLTIAISFLVAFIWSVKNGQYEDDYTPSVRMLFDDAQPTVTSNDTAPDKEQSLVPGSDKLKSSSRYRISKTDKNTK
jgi:cbb3-type cytochrome oxidase maturation protein